MPSSTLTCTGNFIGREDWFCNDAINSYNLIILPHLKIIDRVWYKKSHCILNTLHVRQNYCVLNDEGILLAGVAIAV